MGLIAVFRRFWHDKGKLPRNRALPRHLAVESLEQRALLSVVVTPFPVATQHMTVADLPKAVQQAISSVIGPQAKLTASDGAPDEGFGQSVAVSGNTIVVGAPYITVDSNIVQGAAYVFSDSGAGWVQVAKLTASDSVPGDNFGWSVSISGNTVVVGAPGTTVGYGSLYQGAAYVFTEPGTGWANMTQTAKLTASDGTAQDYFGWSVSISGNSAVVGAENETVGGNYGQGAAYVFTDHGSRWTNMTQTAKLTTSDGTKFDGFGASVSISGETIVVGYFMHGSGQVAADVFTEPSFGWANMTQTAELNVSNVFAAGGTFGPVSISGNTVVVGAYALPPVTPGADDAVPAAMQGAAGTNCEPGAYIFVEPVSGWADMTQTAKLNTSDDAANEYLGWSVSISGKTVVVGASDWFMNGNFGPGAAYVFTEPASGWTNMTQTAKLTASDGERLGTSVVISGNTVVVEGGNTDQGAVYVFGMTTATLPIITLPAIKSAAVGRKYSYQVKTDARAGQEIAFSLGAAPVGMSINASTGLVTWVPNVFQMGSDTVTVLATDQFGDTTEQTFRINVSSFFAFFGPFVPTTSVS
ncbi:MAG: putative Ig domain-containing protein [Thermoguttaceae bacterium]